MSELAFNRKELQKLVDSKHLMVNKHPNADLYIYNYSRSCQYNIDWNEITLACRGLILDGEGNIIARPFGKFFNYEEHQTERLKGKISEIPNLPYIVQRKIDGSLGIVYHINNIPYIATRGSFTSDQAIEGTKILREKYNNVKFNQNYTYCFEIIFPQNMIVVRYGDKRDLVLFAVIDNKTGEEYDIKDPKINLGFEVVKEFPEFSNKTFKQLQKMNIDNEEGYVIKYENNFRVKVKFKEYLRLHKILTNVSEKNIWENLMNGDSLTELIESIPDETYNWVKESITRFKKEYKETEEFAKNTFEKLQKELFGIPFDKHRKRFAQTIFENKETVRIANVLFAMLDGRDYDKMIWKLLKPKNE